MLETTESSELVPIVSMVVAEAGEAGSPK
eukprot:COSAG01_NODE_39256_length_479_cov_0.657895_1_plen_28_part_01